MSDASLLPQFQTSAQQVFGETLARAGFSEAIPTKFGVTFARSDLEIHFSYEPAPFCHMGILVISLPRGNGLAGVGVDLRSLAIRAEKEPAVWSLPEWVADESGLRPALEQWRAAFLEICGLMLLGDLSLLKTPIPREYWERHRQNEKSIELTWEAYGAWLEKDYSRLLDLYDELERLGCPLNERQKPRVGIARAALLKNSAEFRRSRSTRSCPICHAEKLRLRRSAANLARIMLNIVMIPGFIVLAIFTRAPEAFFALLDIPILALAYHCDRCGANIRGGKFRKGDPAKCPRCGYDLTGNVSGTCSECGLALLDPHERARLETAAELNADAARKAKAEPSWEARFLWRHFSPKARQARRKNH